MKSALPFHWKWRSSETLAAKNSELKSRWSSDVWKEMAGWKNSFLTSWPFWAHEWSTIGRNSGRRAALPRSRVENPAVQQTTQWLVRLVLDLMSVRNRRCKWNGETVKPLNFRFYKRPLYKLISGSSPLPRWPGWGGSLECRSCAFQRPGLKEGLLNVLDCEFGRLIRLAFYGRPVMPRNRPKVAKWKGIAWLWPKQKLDEKTSRHNWDKTTMRNR